MRLLRLHHGLAAGHFPLRSITHFPRYFSSSRVNNELTPFTRRLFKYPSPPSPPSQQHNDLTTFLSYAEHESLPVTSTVYIGTHYEYTVRQTLRRYALDLDRIGGRDDAGIDLVGTWHVPEREWGCPLRVLVQCKSLKTKLGPNIVRELEGTFNQAPVGWRTPETIGILVSPREATKGVRFALARSAYPLFWLMIERDGTLKQALWNARAVELGLRPLTLRTRFIPSTGDAGELSQEVMLTWEGCGISSLDEVEHRLNEYAEEFVASWGLSLTEPQKMELLDVAERILPPDSSAWRFRGGISDADRARVLQALQERLQQQPASDSTP
ncbi:hypothetical protein N7535_001546 [Penicillium sp. DV-2018c]|nr:hypothetical protein N7461_005210 [Penicillium sp. DV-2018c]KAJ5582926.1 hypothetical protein N7535_001546 [Penicillium sp. DV-2018c]